MKAKTYLVQGVHTKLLHELVVDVVLLIVFASGKEEYSNENIKEREK